MDAITKAFLTLFCLLIVTFTTTGLVVGQLNSSAADRFLSDSAMAISAGNFQESIIDECVAEADTKGYVLSYVKKDTNGDGYTDVVALSMEYDYKIPYLNTNANKHTINTYVR